METAVTDVKVVGPDDGSEGFLGSIGVRFLIDGIDAGERFSLVEHPMSPRALAAPVHRHTREDEYSFVLEGRMGALLGGDVVEAGPGDLVFKPRNQWHTFWNAGDRAVPDPRDHLACRLRALLPGALRPGRRVGRGSGGGRAAERAVRPRDAAGDGPRPARALRAAAWPAAARRLEAVISA